MKKFSSYVFASFLFCMLLLSFNSFSSEKNQNFFACLSDKYQILDIDEQAFSLEEAAAFKELKKLLLDPNQNAILRRYPVRYRPARIAYILAALESQETEKGLRAICQAVLETGRLGWMNVEYKATLQVANLFFKHRHKPFVVFILLSLLVKNIKPERSGVDFLITLSRLLGPQVLSDKGFAYLEKVSSK